MTTMRSLAIIALPIGGASRALAQNAPPTDGYPPPPPGTSGTPATYGPPAPGVIPGAPGPVYPHHYRRLHPYIVRHCGVSSLADPVWTLGRASDPGSFLTSPNRESRGHADSFLSLQIIR